VSITGKAHSFGQHFAGRRITLRLEPTLAHTSYSTVCWPAPSPDAALPTQRARLQGARTPGPAPLLDQRPAQVQRTVSCRGSIQIIGQRVQAGLRYAGQIVTIEVDDRPRPGLRSHHQSQHWIGTVTHHLKTIRHPSSGTRHLEPDIWNQTGNDSNRSTVGPVAVVTRCPTACRCAKATPSTLSRGPRSHWQTIVEKTTEDEPLPRSLA
jgi:hypothetical protein